MSENKIELTEEDLASVTGGDGALSHLQGTSIGFVISALYEKITAFIGSPYEKIKLTSLVIEIAGYLEVCNYEQVKGLMEVLKLNYTEIYFDIIVVCKTQEVTQIIPEEDRD